MLKEQSSYRLYRDRRIWIVLAVGIAVRLLLSWHHLRQGFIPDSNEEIFWLIARRIAEKGEFGVLGWPGLYMHHGPVYPGLIAGLIKVFGPTYFPILFLQSIFSPLAGLLLAALFGQALRSMKVNVETAKRNEFLIATLLILSPLELLYDRMVMSECLSTLWLISGVAAWISSERLQSLKWRAFAGVLFGLATLTKPVMMPFPFALMAVNIFSGKGMWKSIKNDLLTFVIILIVISPWTYRNYIVSGGRIIPVSDNLGASIFMSASPMKSDTMPIYSPEDQILMYKYMNGTAQEALAIERDFLKRGIKMILNDPVAWFKRSLIKNLRLWVSSHGWYATGKQLSPAIRAFWTVLSALASFFGFLSLFWILLNRKFELYLFAMIPLYYSLVHFATQTGARYVIPAWPFLICCLCYGIISVKEAILLKLKQSKTNQLEQCTT